MLHLNLLFVVLHLLRRIADFRFDLVELGHHLLDLLGQTLTNANLSVVLVLLRLGLVQLRLQLAFNLTFKLDFEVSHFLLVLFHLLLVVFFFRVVIVDSLLDLFADFVVPFHLFGAF